MEDPHFAGDPKARSIIWEKKKLLYTVDSTPEGVRDAAFSLSVFLKWLTLALTGSCPPQLAQANANQILLYYFSSSFWKKQQQQKKKMSLQSTHLPAW